LAGLYTRFVSGVLFPLHERLKGHDSSARLRALEKSQWCAPRELEQHRLARLRAFLAHVGAHVPYYQALFAETGFAPASVDGIDDLQRLPFLTKPLIRANAERLKSRAAGPLKRYTTGGSSGEPLIFYIGPARVSHDVAAKWRATRWWGVDIGDPEIVVWGSPVELGAQDRARAIRDRLLRTELLSAFELSEANLGRFVAAIRKMRPRMLFGYPSALAHIARHVEERGQPMDDLGIQTAFVTAERLYDDQRAQIARTFGCRVANGYGGRDAGFIAHECPEGGMHLSAEDIIVEIVDPASAEPLPAGEAGEIVTTHLATGDFPFLRYRTGDIGVLDTRGCACGRGLPLLKEIQGRSTDFVVAADGTLMHGLSLIYVLRELPGVTAFKILQESVGLTRVQVVPGPGYDDGVARRIVAGVRARLGSGVDVRVETVPAIAPERSGKYRYVVSRVAPHPGQPSENGDKQRVRSGVASTF
jgi:phenylacetate-CoA ligase